MFEEDIILIITTVFVSVLLGAAYLYSGVH